MYSICIYIYTYSKLFTYIINIYIYIHEYISIYIYIYIYTYVYIHIYMMIFIWIYIWICVYIYIHIDVYIHMWNYSNNHDKSQLSPTHRWNTPTSHRGRNRSGGLPGHDLEGQPSPSSHHSPAGWLKMMRKQRDNRLGYVEHVERVYEKKKKKL